MKKYLLQIALFLPFSLTAQEFEWAKSYGQISSDKVQIITVNSFNETTILGFFAGTVDFDDGPEVHTLTGNEGINSNMYILRLDGNGNFLWVKGISYITYLKPLDIATDSEDNLIISGSFWGNVDFDPGEGVFEIESELLYDDCFVLKLTNQGEFLWAKCLHNDNICRIEAMDLTTENEIVLAGAFGNSLDFDPNEGTHLLYSSGPWGYADIFLLKLSSEGEFVWVKQWGNDSGEYVQSLCYASNGSIVLSGGFRGTVDFDPGEDYFWLTPSETSYDDNFILKLSDDGDFEWAYSLVHCSNQSISSLAIDASGNIFWIIRITDTDDIDPTENELILELDVFDMTILLLKFNQDGYLWTKSFCKSTNVYLGGIAIDQGQNCLITGAFKGLWDNSVDFDPSEGVFILSPTPYIRTNTFVLKLNNDGEFENALQFGGSNDCFGTSIISDYTNNIYVTGYYDETVDFDPGIDTTEYTAVGTNDTYLVKLGQCEPDLYETFLEACSGVTHPNGNTYYESSTTVEIYTNAFGCDSLIMHHINVGEVDTDILQTDTSLIAIAEDATFQWLSCYPIYEEITGANSSIFYPPGEGDFAVIITQGACKDTSECINFTGINVIESSKFRITAFPNPGNGIFNLELPYEGLTLTIYEPTGKVIYSEKNARKICRIDLTHFPNGIYFADCSLEKIKLVKTQSK